MCQTSSVVQVTTRATSSGFQIGARQLHGFAAPRPPPVMPPGAMGPPRERAPPARAHVVAAENARAMNRERDALAFQARHERADEARRDGRAPSRASAPPEPPWARHDDTSATAPAPAAAPPLTRAQVPAALRVAAALHADGRDDDAVRVLVGILRPFPGEPKAIELLAAVAVARGVAPKPAGRPGADDTPRAPSAGAEASAAGVPVGVPVPDPPRPRFRIRQDPPRVLPPSPPREPPREPSAAAAAAARDVLAGVARRPSPPRWSRHERILLADRLPPPKPPPRAAAPPPPVTKAELDAELAAKRERLRRERDADVAAARLAAARALEEEAAEKAAAAARRMEMEYAHRDALREKQRSDDARFRAAFASTRDEDAAESRGESGVERPSGDDAGFHGDGDGDDFFPWIEVPERLGKRYEPRARAPPPFAARTEGEGDAREGSSPRTGKRYPPRRREPPPWAARK